MSLQIRSARFGFTNHGVPRRQSFRGDPFVHKKIGGAIGSIGRAAVGAIPIVGGALERAITPTPRVPTPTAMPGTGFMPGGIPGTGQQDPRLFPIPGMPRIMDPAGLFTSGPGVTPQQAAAMNGVACPSGFRPNKTSYFLRDGTFVPVGSKCVKIRRRNPLNPRAADRAISRLESAKRAVGRLQRVTIRKKKC